MRVRAALASDGDAVGRIAADATRAAFEDATLVEHAERDPFGRDVRAWLRERRCALRYVAVDGAVSGFVAFDWLPARTGRFVDDEEAMLSALYVDPDRWHEGVGTRLLETGLERLPARLGTVKLAVLAANPVGPEFYEARGFERVGAVGYDVDGTVYDADVYARPLD